MTSDPSQEGVSREELEIHANMKPGVEGHRDAIRFARHALSLRDKLAAVQSRWDRMLGVLRKWNLHSQGVVDGNPCSVCDHIHHMTAKLLVLPSEDSLLQEAKAKAWDEGESSGRVNEEDSHTPFPSPITNPHRPKPQEGK